MVGTAAPAPAPAPAQRGRLLVADDSVVVRGLVSRWAEESGFPVVATARNGREALAALDRVEPDFVLLDLDMPELDGVAALPLLLARRPALTVLVVSTLTKRNAALSLRCLALGATDYLTKPDSQREVASCAAFRAELVAKLLALDDRRLRRSRDRRRPAPAPVAREGSGTPAASRRAAAPDCLCIGASTGGPAAITQVLSALGPALARTPVIVVQHMPPLFTAAFAQSLSALPGIEAREAADGEILVPGRIHVAPGGRHLGLVRERGQVLARLGDAPPVNFCRPSVDVLFRAAAEVFGAGALAVVLTGMGADGLGGARALVEAGARVLVQDEATSVVWGMPGSVARAGLASRVLPLGEIAPALRRCLGEAGP